MNGAIKTRSPFKERFAALHSGGRCFRASGIGAFLLTPPTALPIVFPRIGRTRKILNCSAFFVGSGRRSSVRAALRCAGVAQLVEHELPKLGVAGSNPVARLHEISDVARTGNFRSARVGRSGTQKGSDPRDWGLCRIRNTEKYRMSESRLICPVCRRETTWESLPRGPFCSERCRLIDLGRWIDGDYRVVGEPAENEADRVESPEDASTRRAQ
jgi:uncharacterized protein